MTNGTTSRLRTAASRLFKKGDDERRPALVISSPIPGTFVHHNAVATSAAAQEERAATESTPVVQHDHQTIRDRDRNVASQMSVFNRRLNTTRDALSNAQNAAIELERQMSILRIELDNTIDVAGTARYLRDGILTQSWAADHPRERLREEVEELEARIERMREDREQLEKMAAELRLRDEIMVAIEYFLDQRRQGRLDPDREGGNATAAGGNRGRNPRI